MIDRGRISLRTILIVLMMSSSLACIAFADGDSRKPTPAEKEFNKSILNALAKALPQCSEGWQKSGSTNVNSDLTAIYSPANESFRIEYYIACEDAKRTQAAQIQLTEELMKLAIKPGFTGNGVEELQAKMAPRDVKIRIDVTANLTSQSIYEKAAPAAAIGGGVAYRSQGEFKPASGWRDGVIYVFLGKPWKTAGGAGSTYVTFTLDKSAAASTVIQNIAVKIQADDARASRLAQSINWEALNALIKK
jgi:hypothetical protein